MRTTTLFLALVTSVIAAPSSSRVPITKRAGPVNGDSYLVKLKPGVSKLSHIASLAFTPTYTYGNTFHGYSAHLQGETLDAVRESKDVEYIVQDGVVSIQNQNSLISAKLEERADANGVHLSKRTGGLGVDFYQIDTGIYTAHTQFGGRAKWGATFGGYPSADGNGHGTTLASLIVGSTYGPANKANITAIKAFGDDGSANLSDIIQGINWVISTANSTGRPSLISITVTIAGYKPFDDAVASATSKGIHVVVAAGDTNEDASGYSPGRAPSAVTVGAILSNGLKLSTSNFGSAVDIWGPGATAKCAWISSPTASVNLIGTTGSAASNVAGILGVEIEKYGNKAPAALEADLKSHAKTVNGFLVAQPW
ncbi:cuticle-degrading protease [Ceratobasidium sp. AG-Ba]|nr:cuticle-degrading protease [Ceratobasidium sp. AG-Ba]QRW13831.1 cuticle-degrading protease [Ceratobasidium sp. AG-Ba]